MLFLSLKTDDEFDLFEIIRQHEPFVDGIELRLDHFAEIDVGMLAKLMEEFQLPFCFTLRRKEYGGEYALPEPERESAILQLLELQPHFFDLELGTRPSFFHSAKLWFPETIFICSYHNAVETPDDLEGILEQMEELPAFAYKICTHANSTFDALRMLNFLKHSGAEGKNLTALCTGVDGEVTRILQGILGGFMNYTCVHAQEETGEGQIPLEILTERYHYNKHSQITQIFALIGDPADKSVAHITHNRTFGAMNENAVYLRMRVLPENLHTSMILMQELGFSGLSVTSPLKSIAYSLVDEIDEEAKATRAVNTICFKHGLMCGYNTDGKGALNPIEQRQKVDGKHLSILGTGGCAKAIAYEAKRRGAIVTLVGRSDEKGQTVADELGVDYIPLSQFGNRLIDILVQATTVGMSPHINELIVPVDSIPKQTLVFDAIYNPRKTALLKECEKRGLETISGIEMFIHQASIQLALFLDQRETPDFIEHELMLSFS